ncbi:MAG: ATP-dependent DNA helicase [Ndongobacter sp.]|nr:ATP-dependent DNA helicase [Ndongobacter sp.]
MSQLNAAQQRAVEKTEGALLIVAGPGTGKTRTLVERVCYLITECRVPAEQITVTTFTRKAAEELISRTTKALRQKGLLYQGGLLNTGNFHQLAQEMIDPFSSRSRLRPGYRVWDDGERVWNLLQEWPHITEQAAYRAVFPGENRSAPVWSIRRFLRWADQLREGLEYGVMDAEQNGQAFAAPQMRRPSEAEQTLLRLYEDVLTAHNAVDFSGLLSEALRMLHEDADVCRSFQERCRYLMVDEYQDINPIQEQIIRKLSEKTGNLCVVGDDDQSLYRFRGATVQNLLTFPKRYPGAQTIYLNENYRSDGQILSFASDFIQYPTDEWQCGQSAVSLSDFRYPKELISAQGRCCPQAVQQFTGADLEEWVARVIGLLKTLFRRVPNYRDIALLSFSLRDARMKRLIAALRAEGIPLCMPHRDPLMEQPLVLAMISCFELLRESLPAVGSPKMRRFTFGAGTESETDREKREAIVRELREELHRGVEPLELGYRFLSTEPFYSVLRRDLEAGAPSEQGEQLSLFFRQLAAFCSEESIWMLDEGNASFFFERFFTVYLPYLREMAFSGTREAGDDEEGLNVMTIHQSKGLEFSVVVIIEPTERQVFVAPKRAGRTLQDAQSVAQDAIKDAEPDEEHAQRFDILRRYYTAFTRAKDLLILTGIDEPWERVMTGQTAERKSAEMKKLLSAGLFRGLHLTLPEFRGESSLNALTFCESSPTIVQRAYAYTTDIVRYRRCPRQYFFVQREQLPEPGTPEERYGQLIHYALEGIHREACRGAALDSIEPNRILDTAAKGMAPLHSLFSPEELDRAKREINRYLATAGRDWWRRIASMEQRLCYSEGVYLLKGQADLLLDEGRTIVDFKTGHPSEEKLRAYSGQLSFYRLMLRHIQQDEEAHGAGALYFTPEDVQEPLRLFAQDTAGQERTAEEVRRVVERIEERSFFERTSEREKCTVCPMRWFCARAQRCTGEGK